MLKQKLGPALLASETAHRHKQQKNETENGFRENKENVTSKARAAVRDVGGSLWYLYIGQ